MTLRPGVRLGAYEIHSAIGTGGMGEVYRATDTSLERQVAIKVLPEDVAADPERLVRFEREAKTLAALNHPNIAQIYGFERSGDFPALIMELVEGPTLAERLKRGPLPLNEALTVAGQVADALQGAHEKQIVHRDLKPANIAITRDGQVKVLDFGLAKLIEPPAESGRFDPSVTAQATISAPAVSLSDVGVILGTAAYMSPEQAKGLPTDKRSDVWAFGCVFYEMVTGARAFGGEGLTETLASVLMKEPDWTALPEDLTPALRALLARTLEKDRARRIADMAACQFVLNELTITSPAVSPKSRRRRGTLVTSVLAGTALVALGAGAYLNRQTPASVTGPVTRLTVVPGAVPLTVNGAGRDIAISPDGRRVAWIGNNGTQLVVRALDQVDPTPIAVVGANPLGMFFSPDGQSIGVFDAGASLWTMSIGGGSSLPVVRADGLPLGASWGTDGSIVFATQNVTTGLQRIAAAGGPLTVLTRPKHDRGEADHRWPQLLPGGDAVLFTIAPISGGIENSQIAVLNLTTGAQKAVLRGGTDARYVASGHLVYAGTTGALWVVGFDLGKLETTGSPVRVLPQAVISTLGAADFDVAENGTLVYVVGAGQAIARTLVWVDRAGKEELTNVPPRAYLNPRLSPDGSRLAIESRDSDGDIWIWDFARQTLRNLTLNPAADRYPVWTSDGSRVIYTSDRDGVLNLYWQAADGSGTPERLATSPNVQDPTAISADGSEALFHETGKTRDIMAVRLAPPHGVRPLLQTPSDEQNAHVSPDGRWFAYQSNETGQFEIHVRPFSDANSGHWQVSMGGGVRPVFSQSGRELFFLTLQGALMSVPLEIGANFIAGTPTKLMGGDYYYGVIGSPRTYDASPDGRRFLMIKPVGEVATPANLVVVQNWNQELSRLVATR